TRRHLHRRAFAVGRQPHLGRDRRRADSPNDRCGQKLEGRDAAADRAVGEKTGRAGPPPQMGRWGTLWVRDASHFDAKSAYAAVNTIRLDDLRPHIYRTTDEGKTWQEIVRGWPNDENVNVVREDPQRRGLLFAGTERGVYLSFDNGDNWQSL